MGNLLDLLEQQHKPIPLAERLRPKTLTDYMGQTSVIGDNTPLRQLVDNKKVTSLLFWGPPGVGKTTLARLIAENSSARFIQLSAVSSGVADLRAVVKDAKEALQMSQSPTVLFIDEIHRYSKTQQDALLPYVEEGTLILMGATTENPAFNVIPALLSRMLLIRLDYLSREDMAAIMKRAVTYLEAHSGPVQLTNDAKHYLLDYANGDARSGLTLLDVAVQCAPQHGGVAVVDVDLLEALAQQNRLNYDRQGDEHYDHASAYQKSMRGSDADAAIYWLAKMIAGGEDPRFIARRLVITASEDVGNADPHALALAMAAAESVERIGLPEARIPLAQATIYVAKAKKSNQAIEAIDKALNDITRHGKAYPVPTHLRDAHYNKAKDFGHGVGYQYTHDNPNTPQTFLPDPLIGTRYVDDLS